MHWRGTYLRIFWLWAVLSPVFGWAQLQAKTNAFSGVDSFGNAETVEAALHQMANQAAVIFVGTVVDVRRSEAPSAGSGIVLIRFSVEQPIRGCSGGIYTLREWSGLWTANDSRYRPGQHLLLLLHAPSASGLSTPVSGMEGAIPLRASGTGIHPNDTTNAAAEEVADLRWIGAKLARKIIYRNPTSPARALVSTSASLTAEAADTTQTGSTPVQETAVSTLLGMLRSWEVTNAR